MKKVMWITSSSFIDTDYYAVKELSNFYSISWFIFHKKNERQEYAEEISSLKNSGVDVCIIDTLEHDRYLRNSFIYSRLCRRIKKEEYDLVYTCVCNAPYFIPILKVFCNKNKVILGVHNVHLPKGASNNTINQMYLNFAIKHFRRFQTFSNDQHSTLKSIVNKKSKVFYAPFFPKDFGESTSVRKENRIVFLNFGNIRDYKKIDVLIRSAERVYEDTNLGFRVIIAGSCNDWERYDSLIKHREIFDIRLGHVSNSDIPKLFEESDYFVAPYKDIAQSGSSIIAVNYEKPIIASKLPAFEEYIKDGENGYLITPSSENELYTVMRRIVESNNSGYQELKKNMAEVKRKFFSTETIVKNYKAFFDEVISE